ncbi:ABC transporter substrate-binding protein [Mesorhizobium sp.]|uniref:ABC transporter substrate-binding protein n=1 Tax=Mesorhizobium sp. TaxID=1871066 RepID=UPI00257F21C6|nr:ABC transporter substrate-binding protein [Mesorhizobium sp.]
MTVARAEPQRGGFAKLGMAHGATTDSIDPAGYLDTFTQTAFSGAMSNSLTEVDAKGSIQPDLAESFETSDDATTWVFKLRKGATFHNGKTVTADDVVASMQYHMGVDTKSAAKSLLESVTNIKADGPETIVFKLNSGNADFPYIMSDYHLVVMPAKDGKADWESGVRTGAFVLENLSARRLGQAQAQSQLLQERQTLF